MKPIIDHIQITVRDLQKAELFYDSFLSLLGFDLAKKAKGRVAKHEFEVIKYQHPLLILGINSPREQFKNETVHRRKPGSLHHLAFRAESRAELDEIALKLKAMEVNIVAGPAFFPEHGAQYYAVFFKDPDGIKYELVFEERAFK